MFSDGFLEGQTKSINDGFPSKSFPYTDHYGYLSDSNLEDELFCSEKEEGFTKGGEPELLRSSQNSHSEASLATVSGNPPWPPPGVSEVGSNITSALNSDNQFIFH